MGALPARHGWPHQPLMTQVVTAPGLVRINGTPVFVCACWTALTFLGLLAAALLLARPRLGVMLTVATITSEVALNVWAGATCGFQVGAFVAESLFLNLVMVTARLAWSRRRSSSLSAGIMVISFPAATKGPQEASTV